MQHSEQCSEQMHWSPRRLEQLLCAYNCLQRAMGLSAFNMTVNFQIRIGTKNIGGAMVNCQVLLTPSSGACKIPQQTGAFISLPQIASKPIGN